MSEHYRLRRLANVDLEFDGDVIAHETSHEPGKSRWTEVRIYRTTTDKWVTEVTGCSAVSGETARIQATACATPEEVVNSFRLWSDRRRKYYFTNICLDALDSAATADPRLAGAIREKV